jgi:hypothetical protein
VCEVLTVIGQTENCEVLTDSFEAVQCEVFTGVGKLYIERY